MLAMQGSSRLDKAYTVKGLILLPTCTTVKPHVKPTQPGHDAEHMQAYSDAEMYSPPISLTTLQLQA
jgi:hypothetical protein